MFGHANEGRLIVDKLVIPKQEARSDFWKTSDEAEIGEFSEANPNLVMYGTIHTHPGFTAKPSSVDLHQHHEIQREQASAIAIIVAPERNESPIYTISRFGMGELGKCKEKGFHPHINFRSLYGFASHVSVDDSINVIIIDQR